MKTTSLYSLILMLLLAAGLVSCERQVSIREYEEITLSSPLEHSMGAQSDPHAFMKDSPDMGFDHPDIFGSMPMMAGAPMDPQTQQALAASVAKAPLTWTTPEGWSEEPGSSMRVVTFRTKDDAGGIECSIVSLGGQAGGNQSNVIRWMRQINIDVPAADQLDKFLSGQEIFKAEGGFDIQLIDLSGFTPEDASPSMIAAIAQLPDMTIFVKMIGAKKALLVNRDKFTSLCKSLKLK